MQSPNLTTNPSAPEQEIDRPLPQATWRVSVIIPLYQGEAYIEQALRSALDQTYPAHEILVVDDGSRDRGPEIARRFGEPVRVLTKPNGGPGSARNLGAAQATGDILAFLDQDDVWAPEKLERQLPYFSDVQVSLVHCAARPWDVDVSTPVKTTFDELWNRNRIVQCSVLLRRSVFEALGPFETDLIGIEDYNYWLRLAATGHSLLQCPGRLCRWDQNPTSYSRNSGRMYEAECRNVDRIAALNVLSPPQIRAKRLELAMQYGYELFNQRDLRAARRLFAKAVQTAPNARAIGWLLTTFVPQALLDTVRRKRVEKNEEILHSP